MLMDGGKIEKLLVCVQNDQRVTGILLKCVCWGTHQPPPGALSDRDRLSIVRGRAREPMVGGGVGKGGSKAPPPLPPQPNFLPTSFHPSSAKAAVAPPPPPPPQASRTQRGNEDPPSMCGSMAQSGLAWRWPGKRFNPIHIPIPAAPKSPSPTAPKPRVPRGSKAPHQRSQIKDFELRSTDNAVFGSGSPGDSALWCWCCRGEGPWGHG